MSNQESSETQISIGRLMTPQEHILAGSTPPDLPRNEEEFYRPIAINQGTSPDIIRRLREERGYFIINFSPFFPSSLAATFEPLTDNSTTVRDPKILGEIDKENGKIVPHPERDLTGELYAQYHTPETAEFVKSIGYPIERPHPKNLQEGEAQCPSFPERR